MLRIRTFLASAAGVIVAGLLSLALSPTPHAAAAGNTYPYGQCTYYAKAQRPDIGNHWGDARFWDTSARAAGFPVDGKPRVGDVVVLERNVQGISPHGHVGIVTLVQGNRFKTISMWGNEATGKLHVAWHTTGAGVSFIHKRGTATTASTKITTAKTTTTAKKATTTAKKTTTAAKKATTTKATAKKTTTKATAKKATTTKATAKKATTTKATAKKATTTKATAKKTTAAKKTTVKKVTPVKKVVVTHKKP